MTPKNILDIHTRDDFRKWLLNNSTSEKECWIEVKRGKIPPENGLWYLDAVEEALCFGWIDSTLKKIDGISLQRFSKRQKKSVWTELNKERCRRLEKLGLMTDRGREVCPDLDTDFEIDEDILTRLKNNPLAYNNFQLFPGLYRRVRIDNIQRVRECKELFDSRLKKLIEASESGEMIGEWNDGGRLIDY
ncbi:MAG: YdeI/OmpD-associated family protein [Paramuribaculum sp.]|nr:YdeI/OmpD-associated family protein [Paramuribaculum sp.]